MDKVHAKWIFGKSSVNEARGRSASRPCCRPLAATNPASLPWRVDVPGVEVGAPDGALQWPHFHVDGNVFPTWNGANCFIQCGNQVCVVLDQHNIMDWAIGGIDMSMGKYAGIDCIQYVDLTWRRVETCLILIACLYLAAFPPRQSRPQMAAGPPLPLLGHGDRVQVRLQNRDLPPEPLPHHHSHPDLPAKRPAEQNSHGPLSPTLELPERASARFDLLRNGDQSGEWMGAVGDAPFAGMRFQLPLEAAVYWLQHGLMLIVPSYLLRLGGVYTVEPVKTIQWNVLAYSLLVAYHFTVLQGVSLLTNINMNHIMCPLEADPFRGQLFRTAVFFHQGLLCPTVCKAYVLLANYFLIKFN
ncbi:hypothetical protein HUJ05_005437 [Dendroctonus ponderosae]|nr:hypothetical protein HUJ05_005437 [Dendroctonus ponderosae]KAH1004650.1 hypothetical protein HUJ05_005437 [Dendroctonus ponderosae]